MHSVYFEIGRVFDVAGHPLFVADGKIVGTVDEVKAAIAAFEGKSSCEDRPSPPVTPQLDDLDARVIAIVRDAMARRVL